MKGALYLGMLCAPAVFQKVMHSGVPLVRGLSVTAFTNSEEAAVGLAAVVPILVEDELKQIGAVFETAVGWASFALVDGSSPARTLPLRPLRRISS